MLVAFACGFAAAEGPPAPAQSGGDDSPSLPIEEFVRQTYFHGVPYREATAYGPAVVPKLLEMLSDPREEEHWKNIVVTLCLVGGREVAGPIERFIGTPAGEVLSRPSYDAKSNAIIALGYLVHRTGSEEALSYLAAGVDPERWRERLSWQSPYVPLEARDEQLAQLAILGLALSGRPAALAVLEAQRDEKHAQTPQMRGVIEEAIATNQTIQRRGLASYLSEKAR
jgi:hypothetical protein